MTTDTNRTSLLSRLWLAILAVSEVAVSIHYAAPWDRTKPANSALREPHADMLACAAC